MIGVNKVILLGRVATDVQPRTTRTGKQVLRFSVAIPRRNGDGQTTADFFDVVAWDRHAEVCGRYLNKGDRVYIEGRLNRSSWLDSEGRTRHRTEVTASRISFLGRPGGPAGTDVEAELEPPTVEESA